MGIFYKRELLQVILKDKLQYIEEVRKLKKEKWLIIIGNILLFITCILQVIVKLSSEVYVTLITISVLLELIGIALGKEE